MPSKKSRNDLILFSSQDPRALVNWLCDTYGLSAILQSVAQYQTSSSAAEMPTKRAYKKRGAKKGGAKKSASKKAGAKRSRKADTEKS